MVAERARLHWAAIAVLCIGLSTANAAESSLSESELLAAIEPVSSAIKSAEDRRDRLPAARTDAEKLIRMADVEQAGRTALAKVGHKRVRPRQRPVTVRSAPTADIGIDPGT